MSKRRRIRDPIHGLIVFEDEKLDALAWDLIDTSEFQRLRRIKQLGFSEYVFPGATHTRFAHSVGVFNNARLLAKKIDRLATKAQSPESDRNEKREIAVLAALLHDIGHGPFSHTFEGVEKSRQKDGKAIKHEIWTADIIMNENGNIFPLLEAHSPGLSKKISELLRNDTPQDIYHSIVSSSFDADRLDYLRRDKLMAGTGAGAIDFDWLMDNLLIADIDHAPDDAPESMTRPSFCFDYRAAQATENFLLSRYYLHEQVYLHKVTRGLEKLLAAVLGQLSKLCAEGKAAQSGLPNKNPVIEYFSQEKPKVEHYLALDDYEIITAVQQMTKAKDPVLKELATRLAQRNTFRCIDITAEFGGDEEKIRKAVRAIKAAFKDRLGIDVLFDEVTFSVYGVVGADDEKAHKRIMIRRANGDLSEITTSSPNLKAIAPRELKRFYVADNVVFDEVRKSGGLNAA